MTDGLRNNYKSRDPLGHFKLKLSNAREDGALAGTPKPHPKTIAKKKTAKDLLMDCFVHGMITLNKKHVIVLLKHLNIESYDTIIRKLEAGIHVPKEDIAVALTSPEQVSKKKPKQKEPKEKTIKAAPEKPTALEILTKHPDRKIEPSKVNKPDSSAENFLEQLSADQQAALRDKVNQAWRNKTEENWRFRLDKTDKLKSVGNGL